MSWNKPSEAPKVAPKKKPSAMRGILAGLAVVIVATGVIFLLPRREQQPSSKSVSKSLPKSIGEIATRIAKQKPDEVLTHVEPEINVPAFPRTIWLGRKVVRYSVSTNENGVVTEVLWTDDGNRHTIDSRIKGPRFTKTDQLILMAVSSDSRKSMPPLPIMGTLDDSRVRRDLAKPIEITDADSPALRARKEHLIAVRKEVLARMDEGMSFNEIMSNHDTVTRANNELRLEAQKSVTDMAVSGDREGAIILAQKLNEKLDEMGIDHVQVPLSQEERATMQSTLRKEFKAMKNSSPKKGNAQ